MSPVALQRALTDDERQLREVQRAKATILNLIRNSARKVPWMQQRLRLFGTLVHSRNLLGYEEFWSSTKFNSAAKFFIF